MSQNHRGSRTSGHCRDTYFGAPTLELERTVPASSLRNFFFGSIMLVVAIAGIAALMFVPSKKHTIFFPTGALYSVQEWDQKITQKEVRLAILTKRGLVAREDISEYYRLLFDLQELRMSRAQYALNYNGLARNLFEREGVAPADFQKAGFPAGIQ